MSSKTNEYIPGECNIGEEEIRGRKRTLLISICFAILFIVLIQVFHINHFWRLFLFIPVSIVVISWLQVYMKFCVALGMKGLFNFGEAGNFSKVKSEENLKKDRNKASRMIFMGIVIGVVAAVIYYLLPV